MGGGPLHPCVQAQAGAGLSHLCVDHGIGVTGLGGSEPDSDQVSPVSLGRPISCAALYWGLLTSCRWHWVCDSSSPEAACVPSGSTLSLVKSHEMILTPHSLVIPNMEHVDSCLVLLCGLRGRGGRVEAWRGGEDRWDLEGGTDGAWREGRTGAAWGVREGQMGPGGGGRCVCRDLNCMPLVCQALC